MRLGKIFLGSLMTLGLGIIGMNAIQSHAEKYIDDGVNIALNLGINDASLKNKSNNVTDKSEMNSKQPYANIYLKNYNYYNTVSRIKNAGYKTLVVVFELDIKEVNDGYQELFLYDNASNSASKLVPGYTAFEHVPGKKGSSFERYEFYAEVPVERLDDESDSFTLRFGAHGNNSDDWKFQNLQVQLCLSYEEAKITRLAWVKNANTYIVK